MTLLHVIDAFTDRPFSGNPAAVCLTDGPREEYWMRNVAREMNLSETAFLHPAEAGYALRWFTPAAEVALCGHATLASAFALWHTGALSSGQEARFTTRSGGLTCRRSGDWIEMDFPGLPVTRIATPPGLADALGAPVSFCAGNGMDCLVEVADAPTLRGLVPDFSALARLPVRGVIATCRADTPEFDFLSRFFAPAVGVNEDPVTGSAHCALGPHWRDRLGKADLTAFQASERGGVVRLSVRGDRVLLRGRAVLVSRVELFA